MAAVRGIPDWQNSFGTETFTLLPAYDDESFYFLLPRVVRLADRPDKTPDFALEFVSDLNGASVEDSLYANLNMGLTRAGEMQRAYQFLARQKPAAALIPASFATESYWYFEGKGIQQSDAFAWEDVDRARIYKRIPSDLGNLIYGAFGSTSLLLARAAIGSEIAAFLPRLETTASFETAKLLSALADLSSGGGPVPFKSIENFFVHPPTGLLAFSGNDSGDSGRNRALALAGRVRHFLGQSARSPQIADGPHITLRSPSDAALQKRTVWDLGTPLMATVPMLLDFDPFTPVIEHGGRNKVTSFTRVPPLPNDRLIERVVVAANLPPNILTHEAIDITLRVGADLSRSGSPTAQTVSLYPPSGQTPVIELKFGRSLAKSYSTRIRAISDAGILESAWFECSGDYLYIGTENLPGICVTIRATPQLLSQARISAGIVGDPRTENLVASLSESQPAATYLLPAVRDAARLVVTAQDPTDAGKTRRLDLPCRSVSLDLLAFLQYGPQTVSVTVRFPQGFKSLDCEFLPEDSNDTSRILTFTPAANSVQWSYYANNLFRNRYRFRRVPAAGSPEPEWSDYRSPADPLIISA